MRGAPALKVQGSVIATAALEKETVMSDKTIMGVLYCLVAGVAWGAQFPIAGSVYTTLSCILGTASALVIVVLATIAGYLKVPDVETAATIRWEMGYMIVISGVLAIFSWNAGNRALAPINGILFINVVPVTTFAISVLSGYNMSKLEVTGAIITVGALVSNNLYQRKLIRAKSVIPTGVPAATGAAR